MSSVAAARPVASDRIWARMRLWAAAHAVDDLYQGLVPATIPYFVLERHYGYLAVSGLTLAATLGSSLPQPLIGLIVDRRPMRAMAALGVSLAGLGAGLAGVAPGYGLTWSLLFVSGIGVAMFHPAAGKAARERAGDSATAMSLFAAGGSVGFFLAPLFATPALDSLGLTATALFILPALLIGAVLLRAQWRYTAPAASGRAAIGSDRWGPFLMLTAVEIVRSTIFFGVNTFIGLYWIRHFHASNTVAGAALASFLVGSVGGTLLGGRIADRFGSVPTIRIGTVVAIPALVALRLCPNAGVGLLGAVLAGIAVNVPFSILIKLGQDYLPSRPGTASGVTLGLAVSAGGLALPAFGALADGHGVTAVFTILPLVPLLALALVKFLPAPDRRTT